MYVLVGNFVLVEFTKAVPLKVSICRKKKSRAVTSPKNEQTNFKFQAFLSRQDIKTNSCVRFLGEVTTRLFFFDIY